MQERTNSVRKPASHVENVRLDPDLKADLHNTAARLGVERSKLVRASLRRYLGALDAGEVEMSEDPELWAAVRARELRDRAAEGLARLRSAG